MNLKFRAIEFKKDSSQFAKRVNKQVIFLGMTIIVLILLNFIVRLDVVTLPEVIKVMLLSMQYFIITYFFATLLIRVTAQKVASLFADEDSIEMRILSRKLYGAIIYVFATFIVLGYLGVTTSNLTIIAGFATTGFALAFRDFFLSYFIWFMLLTKKPFHIGDYISIDGIEGFVKHIGVFYVILINPQNHKEEFHKVPNKLFIEKPIHNYGRKLYSERLYVPLVKPFTQKNDDELRLLFEKLKETHHSLDVLSTNISSRDAIIYLEIKYAVSISKKLVIRKAVMDFLQPHLFKK